MTRKVLILLLGLTACTAVVTVFGENGIFKVLTLRRYCGDLERVVLDIRKENEILTREIEKLKNDPNIIEKIAREKLGLAKEGDIIYSFKNPHLSTPAIPSD